MAISSDGSKTLTVVREPFHDSYPLNKTGAIIRQNQARDSTFTQQQAANYRPSVRNTRSFFDLQSHQHLRFSHPVACIHYPVRNMPTC